MAKQLLFDDRARIKLLRGVETLAKAVAVTMGPTGRNVIIDKSFGNPVVTKDGVTVSKEVELEDPYEHMGAKLVNEVASKTSDTAGDGTTTATVLARAIYSEGLRSISLGANPTVVRKARSCRMASRLKLVFGAERRRRGMQRAWCRERRGGSPSCHRCPWPTYTATRAPPRHAFA